MALECLVVSCVESVKICDVDESEALRRLMVLELWVEVMAEAEANGRLASFGEAFIN